MAGSDVVPVVGYSMAGSDVVPLCLWWVYLSDVFHANIFLRTFMCRFCIHASVLHHFHATLVSASLVASSFVHSNTSTVSLQSRSHVSGLHQHASS